MPSKITASYRIVTPMFIGDAKQEASGISPTSVKGALRFWWRALNWSKFLNAAENEADALRKLHKYEAELFGGLPETIKNEQTGKSETTGGQGAFLLRVESKDIKKLDVSKLNADQDYKLGNIPIATEKQGKFRLNGYNSWQSYLLGLGLMKYENRENHYLRSAIVSGNFSVQLYCKNSKYLKELENLLLLWGLLGGLGSRQRKGLGSISITELKVGDEIIELPQNQQAVLDTLKKRIDKSATGEPPFTAFSQSSQILCSPSKTQTPWQTLAEIAKEIQMFRGWGFKGEYNEVHKINELPVNHTAYSDKPADHKIVYNYYLSPKVLPQQLPKSYTFGLPRSYTLSIPPKNGEQKPKRIEFKLDVLARDKTKKVDNINKRSRRASPVFIHIHQFPNNDKDSMIIQSFLPATFLPQQDIVQIKQKIKLPNNKTEWRDIDNIAVDAKKNWLVIEEYFNFKGFSEWSPVWKELI